MDGPSEHDHDQVAKETLKMGDAYKTALVFEAGPRLCFITLFFFFASAWLEHGPSHMSLRDMVEAEGLLDEWPDLSPGSSGF